MTESIFVPFRLTDEESVKKVVAVLEKEPEPWPKSEEKFSVDYLEKMA